MNPIIHFLIYSSLLHPMKVRHARAAIQTDLDSIVTSGEELRKLNPLASLYIGMVENDVAILRLDKPFTAKFGKDIDTLKADCKLLDAEVAREEAQEYQQAQEIGNRSVL